MHRAVMALATTVAILSALMVLPLRAAGATVSAAEDSGVSVGRYGGADRYATSLLVAEAVAAYAGGSLDLVVMVSGRSWPDAVVAAPVAGALGSPVLMTPPGELRTDAAAFLQRTHVTSVVVVGSTGGADAVGAEVTAALEELGISVERVGRVDRYGTGVVAARRLTPGVMPGLGATAIVASGEVFADALVAGPFAARGHHPVLLTPPDRLHAGVAAHLSTARVEHVVLMGGTGALSEAVEASITDLGISVTRLAGATRFDTAVQAAELVSGRYTDVAGVPCFATERIGLARARVPFDSFSAAPLLGRLCAPLLLAEPDAVPADTAAFVDIARGEHATVALRVFGGDSAVSRAAIDAYIDAGEARPAVLPAGTCGGTFTDELRRLVPSTSAEDPAWSPDCSQLVFTQYGSLWTVNNDGSNEQPLMSSAGVYLHSAAWSPDGTQVAYVGGYQDDDHWVAHIWTVNADGTGASQLTEGDVTDASPRWSPTGELIVFDRFSDGSKHVMRMAPDGTNAEQLTSDDSHNDDPVYSPDGSQLAYVSGSQVVGAEADGSNPLPIISSVAGEGGLSWSPDGRRIAFVRRGNDRQTLFTADVRSRLEETVYESEEGSVVRAPRWSPDGQLMAFHTIDRSGKHRALVIGARGVANPDGSTECRPRGTRSTTAGFPLPNWAAPSTGTVRVAVLFMDFPDAEAPHTTDDEAVRALPYIEDYLESASYGRLDVAFVPHDGWLRSAQEHGSFVGTNVLDNQAVTTQAIDHAIGLAEPRFDFTDIDAVMVVLPSSHFGGGGFAPSSVSVGDGSRPASLINSVHRGIEQEPSTWGSVGSHELTHNLGLADLYPYDSEQHALFEAPADMIWVAAQWGRMNMWSWYLAAEHDPRMAHVWTYPDGVGSTSYRLHLSIEEMLAWSRWQLGWLGESQVRCLNSPEAVVTLTPIAQPGTGVAMAAVPLNRHELIVVESRRKLGYDAGTFYEAPDTGASTTFPRLITEGVLVYTVDSSLGSGDLPLKVAGDSGNGQVDDFPVLEAGDSLTVRGYTITVTRDGGDTHTVTITRND